MRSPIFWFGGKGPLTGWLLKHMPEHRVYVEVFGGGASLLFAKRPSEIEVYNDIDDGLVGFFRTLRDPDLFPELHRRLLLTPYARGEYEECRRMWREQTDPVERARQWYVVARQSFSGWFGSSWGFAVSVSRRGMSMTTSRWLTAVGELPGAHTRLLRVQIERQDWRKIFDIYDGSDTLFYVDPPYVAATRRAGEYAHELTDADHAELLERLLCIQGNALCSGYAAEEYATLDHSGWARYSVDMPCWSAAKTRATGLQGNGACEANQRRQECLWVSPSARQPTLFDFAE